MDGKLNRSAEIDNLMGAPGFWDNPQKAQTLVDERRRLTAQIKPLQELVAAADDLAVLMQFDLTEPFPQGIDRRRQFLGAGLVFLGELHQHRQVIGGGHQFLQRLDLGG